MYNVDRKERCKSAYIQSDKWVVGIKEATTALELATLIVSRFNRPYIVGPTLIWTHTKQEHPADIIVDFVDTSQLDIDDIEAACQFIMNKVADNEPLSSTSSETISENYQILGYLYYLISRLNLVSCCNPLVKWVRKNYTEYSKRKHLKGWTDCYREAIEALADIQPINQPGWSKWWLAIWKADSTDLWYGAMDGLIIQSPVLALDHIPEMINRQLPDYGYLLHKLWYNLTTRSSMEELFLSGLMAQQEWSGLAINALANTLTEDKQGVFIKNLYDIKKFSNNTALTIDA